MSKPRHEPTQVWITWCNHCGQADYAFNEKPKDEPGKHAYPGCPKCDTGPQFQRVAGPFVLSTLVLGGQEVLDKAKRLGKLSRGKGTSHQRQEEAKDALIETVKRVYGH